MIKKKDLKNKESSFQQEKNSKEIKKYKSTLVKICPPSRKVMQLIKKPWIKENNNMEKLCRTWDSSEFLLFQFKNISLI